MLGRGDPPSSAGVARHVAFGRYSPRGGETRLATLPLTFLGDPSRSCLTETARNGPYGAERRQYKVSPQARRRNETVAGPLLVRGRTPARESAKHKTAASNGREWTQQALSRGLPGLDTSRYGDARANRRHPQGIRAAPRERKVRTRPTRLTDINPTELGSARSANYGPKAREVVVTRT